MCASICLNSLPQVSSESRKRAEITVLRVLEVVAAVRCVKTFQREVAASLAWVLPVAFNLSSFALVALTESVCPAKDISIIPTMLLKYIDCALLGAVVLPPRSCAFAEHSAQPWG